MTCFESKSPNPVPIGHFMWYVVAGNNTSKQLTARVNKTNNTYMTTPLRTYTILNETIHGQSQWLMKVRNAELVYS